MAHRLPQHVVNTLNEVINAATLKTANFGSDSMVILTQESGSSREFDSITDLVRDTVRLHHDSWVIGPLKQILTWSDDR